MKALILSAGYATRLYPLTKDFPKSLLLVGDRPIIDYIINKLESIEEINEIIIVTNSRFFSLFRKWADDLKIKKNLSIVDDLTATNEDKRGAIGDIDFVIKNKQIKEDLLVIGGDNIFSGDLFGFLSFSQHVRPYPVIGAYDIKDRKQAVKYGVIELNEKNVIVDFEEKPSNPNSALVAMCLYFFPAEKLTRIDEYFGMENNKKDAVGFYIDWLRKRESIYGYVFQGRWYDIGDRKFYNQANEEFSIDR